jgi:hypothetical protein
MRPPVLVQRKSPPSLATTMNPAERPRLGRLDGAAPELTIIKTAPPKPLALGARRLGLVLVISMAMLGCERRSHGDAPVETEAKPVPKAAVPALDVSLAYPSVESLGATKRIRWEKTPPVDAHSPPDAWKVTFAGSGDFAGICWKNKPGNEGGAPGDDLSRGGYRRISFWARGRVGGESVEFRAGGLGDVKTRYRDSFDLSAGRLRLTTAWKEYGIYVTNADLSSVMTPFCVLLHREDNPGEAVIYVDDIEYRG